MSEKFTRREFLQSACISVGALATTAGATNVFAGELPKGNENGLPSVDVLIIGSGGAGLRAAPPFASNIQTQPSLSLQR